MANGYMYPQKTIDRLNKRIDILVRSLEIIVNSGEEASFIRGDNPPEWIKLARQVIKENRNV